MPTFALYGLIVAIWGSTWVMITWQLGTVPLQASLTYRFAIAASALAAYGLVTGRRLRLQRRDIPAVAAQGILLFSLNYFFVYAGTAYIVSGLVAVLFTMLVLFNAINERIFFGTRISALSLAAGLLALSGIALMFWPEISELDLSDDTIRGMGLVLVGAFMASLGNMAAIRNTRARLPIVAVNVWGMAIGACASAAYAALSGAEFIVDWHFRYIGSLLFLALPGTAVAFGMYLVVLDRIGATRASYISVMLPVVALLISTGVEGYQWTWLATLGLTLALAGNALALSVKTENSRRRTTDG